MRSKHKPNFSRLLLLAAGLIVLVNCGGKACEIPVHHALVIMNYYYPQSKGTNLVIPYQVNLLALDLLQSSGITTSQQVKTVAQKNIISQCQQYIQWYLNHVNPSDAYGLTGTIYNYELDGQGKEQFQKDMEFTDRTAATFILLVHRFYQLTGYRQMLSQAKNKIENIAYLIPHLQDEADGLIRTLPMGNQKLLENNCFAYAAMDAFVELATAFGWSKPSFYQEVRDGISEAILEKFYRPNHGEFYWQISGQGTQLLQYAIDWNTLYPDSYSQLFPLLFGILPPEEQEVRDQLWAKFCGLYDSQLTKKAENKESLLMSIIYKWTAQKMRKK